VILDHHKPARDSEANNIVHINAHLFGYNGSVDICAATLAFILGVHISPQNWDLIHLALAGAIGDKQNKNGFKSFNLKLLDTAQDLGLIKQSLEFKPSGKSIKDALVRATDPYFVGLSNNESAVSTLLQSLDIDAATAPGDIDSDAMQRLVSYLSLKLVEQGISAEDARGVITTKYYFKDSEVHIEELSHQINACGRMNQMGVGVAAALGDAEAIKIAKRLRNEYKQKVRDGLARLEADRPKELTNIGYFYESVSELAGTFAGIGMMYFFNQSKPVIAITKNEKNIKISGRGTKRLIDQGLDLASALSQAATSVDGTGGGHNIAAGATIPLDSEQEFLGKVDELVGKQLNSKSD
jgi:RecJ-like exonuclease